MNHAGTSDALAYTTQQVSRLDAAYVRYQTAQTEEERRAALADIQAERMKLAPDYYRTTLKETQS